jgi:hypothetical protein
VRYGAIDSIDPAECLHCHRRSSPRPIERSTTRCERLIVRAMGSSHRVERSNRWITRMQRRAKRSNRRIECSHQRAKRSTAALERSPRRVKCLAQATERSSRGGMCPDGPAGRSHRRVNVFAPALERSHRRLKHSSRGIERSHRRVERLSRALERSHPRAKCLDGSHRARVQTDGFAIAPSHGSRRSGSRPASRSLPDRWPLSRERARARGSPSCASLPLVGPSS